MNSLDSIQLLIHLLFRAGRSCLITESTGVSLLAEGSSSLSIFLATTASLSLGIGSLNRSLRFFNFSTVSRCRSSNGFEPASLTSRSVPSLSSVNECWRSTVSTGLEGSSEILLPSRDLLLLLSDSFNFKVDDDLLLIEKSLSLLLVHRSNFDRPLLESCCSSSEEASSFRFLED